MGTGQEKQVIVVLSVLTTKKSISCISNLFYSYLKWPVSPTWNSNLEAGMKFSVADIECPFTLKPWLVYVTNIKFKKKSFLTQIEGLRTEDVVHCTDCKAHWGNVFVILGYINTIWCMFYCAFVSLSQWSSQLNFWSYSSMSLSH